MPIDPWRPCNPDVGDHFWIVERRFRYLVQDPTRDLRVSWIPTVLDCPVCGAEHGTRLALQESQDLLVQAQCHRGHTWPEPRIDPRWYTAWSRIRTGTGDEDMLWLTEAGFGEEPPEPIDQLHQLKEGWAYGAKYVGRKAKNKVKAEVRRPVKKAKKKAANEAMRPVAAALRTMWGWQAGGTDPVKQPRPKKTPAPPKTPPVSAYRAAYGMDAPKKGGPTCLVCEDTRRITAPGISIPCSECGTGPTPNTQSDSASSDTRTVTGSGITLESAHGRTVVNQNNGAQTRISREAHDAIDRAARLGPATNNDDVVIRGENTNNRVQSHSTGRAKGGD